MTAITHTPGRDCVNTLGIPVDNLSPRQAIDRIIKLARSRDGRARLVSTLNVDFLVNSLGYSGTRPRHPELLAVLRNSALVTADGFPIVWLSKLIGKPLKARVTGADMVPALARRAATQGLSLFLLGGGENAAAAAAHKLQQANPGLRIAGTAAPMVHVSGQGLVDWAAEDERLVRQVNASGADILLLGLGNPKQELWFNRNQEKLRVPVAIGVGGTFEFINGTVKRAPAWVQRLNLEWLFRITQDPARLWRRYVKGLFKLGLLTAPLVYFRAAEILFYRRRDDADRVELNWQSVWSSRNQSLALLRPPRVVSAGYLQALVANLQQEQASTALRLIDFSAVRHVEIAAQQEFFRLARLLHDAGSSISLLGMTGAVKRYLGACRILDVIGEDRGGDTLGTLSYAPAAGAQRTAGCNSYVMNGTTLIFLSGRVSGEGLAALGLVECLKHAARGRTCILDLRNVSLLESTAIAELQPLLAAPQSGDGAIMVSGAGATTRQMFQMSGLGESVLFIDDQALLASIGAGGCRHA